MKQCLRLLCLCTGLFYACQRNTEGVSPLETQGALRVAPAAARPIKCTGALQVTINSTFKDFDRLFLLQVMYVGQNGKDSSLIRSVYQELFNGSKVALTGLAPGKQVRLRLYENDLDLTKYVTSGTFPTCGQPSVEFDLRAFKLAAPATPITFQLKFPCNDVDEKKLPAKVGVEFRQTGTTTWLPLTTLSPKDVKKNLLQTTSYRLVKGRTYDLRLNVFGILLAQKPTTLTKDVWEMPVDTKAYCK